MTHAISLGRFFLLLLLGAALLGGCQNVGPDPLPRAQRTDFSGDVTRLSLDLPGQFPAQVQPMAVPPEAAPFVLNAARFQPKKEAGIALQIAAIRFDEKRVAERFGPPHTPERQRFYDVFQDALLSALLPEFQGKDAASAVTDTRETLSVNGRTLTILSVNYLSSFNTPGTFKLVFIPDDRETWLVTLLYDVGDKRLPTEIERIIQSIRVNG